MLLDVTGRILSKDRSARAVALGLLAAALLWAWVVPLPNATASSQQDPPQNQPPSGTPAPPGQSQPSPAPQTSPPPGTPPVGTTAIPANPQKSGLNIVVLDPAHGGTDLGARGTGGMRESEIVMDFAQQVRRALETQGFQVIQTRQGDEDPSFDDRSARANALPGALFVTLHIASTGLPGTARTYVMSDLPPISDATGLISWDRAQAPFLILSKKFGDSVQNLLARQFKGSPEVAESAPVRQLRTTAAPAIAVEVSSVAVAGRSELDHMGPGIADAIARGAAAFRPSYVIPANLGRQP